jgi:HlyD family secretion protein
LQNVLLVPNSALRFKPSTGAQGGGITSVLPGPGRMRRGGAKRQVNFGAGSSQTVYVVGEDGNPKALQVTVGASDGTRTAVTGGALKAGMRVITGQLAAGQEAPAEDQKDDQGVGQRSDAKSDDRRRNPSADGSPATVGKLGNSGDAAPQTAPVEASPNQPTTSAGSSGTGRQTGN